MCTIFDPTSFMTFGGENDDRPVKVECVVAIVSDVGIDTQDKSFPPRANGVSVP